MVGQGSRSRDETGGTCATRLPAVELGPGAGRERLELPRCRQQLRYPIHPYRCPSTMLEACVARVWGNSIVRQDRLGLSRT